MANNKIGDFVQCRGFFGIQIFAEIKSIEEVMGVNEYTIEGPEGEYKMFSPQSLTKKDAKEWINKLEDNIQFLKTI
jgi:hypothetical protein